MESHKVHAAGSIKVSVDVLVKIAETAAAEIKGIALDGQHLAVTGVKSGLFGAVRVHLSGETASISIEIIVLEGYNAVTVAESVQNSVKYAIQSMTGYTVTKVDVNIAGVRLKEQPAE